MERRPVVCYPPRPMFRTALIATTILALSACSTKHVSLGGEIKHGKTAEENYQAGMELMAKESWPEAQKFFEFVKTKYPFSKFASLADLRLADLKFEQKLYAEAIEAYTQFMKLRPTSDELDYAEFRMALAFFEDAPGDFVLFPAAHEKDMRQMDRAVTALAGFLEKHPKSKHAPDARKLLARGKERLAAREWYVAEYYFQRHRWPGAAGRYETLVEKFPGSSHEAEALWKLAAAYVKMDEKHRARTALQKLLVKHPESPLRPEAEKLLAGLR